MKIIYEFDSFEEQVEHKIFAQAHKMYALLCDLQDELRSTCKHGKPTKQDHYWKQRLNEMLLERNVEIV